MGVSPSRFRVSLAGTLFDSDARVRPADSWVRTFLGSLAEALMGETETSATSLLFTEDDAGILLSGVVTAQSKAEALDIASRAFEAAISTAGGQSDLPDGTDPAWRLQHLVDLARASVVPLVAA